MSKDGHPRYPSNQELRQDLSEVPIHGKKKDTKRWCRGKVGREHEPEIRVNKWPYEITECCWRENWLGTGRWQWCCRHERGCSVCGKILQYYLRDKCCPDFHERENGL